MLKLNAGFSRKVGEPNYGSRGASVNVELELESGLISDPDALMARVRQLFAIAKRSVDAELDGGAPAAGDGQGHNDRGPAHRDTAGANGQERVRYATASQVRAIRSICQRQGLDPDQLANQRYAVNNVDELTLREASSIIDELKAAQRSGGNGGGR
jgi:hypothetical protein